MILSSYRTSILHPIIAIINSGSFKMVVKNALLLFVQQLTKYIHSITTEEWNHQLAL